MSNKLQERSKSLNSKIQKEISYSIFDLMLIIAKNLKIIIFITFILAFITIIKDSFFVEPVFTSTSKIMSSSGKTGSTSQAAGLAAQFGISIPTSNSEATSWVYPEILKSRTLAGKVLARRFDSNELGSQKTLLEILDFNEKTSGKSQKEINFLSIKKFLGMINVSENIKTKIYSISVDASEPDLASDINEALIDELNKHQLKYNKSQTSEAKKFIEERIIEINKELTISEEILKDFSDRNRRIENSPALQLQRQRLEREVVVLTGVFTTLKQQYETTKIEELKDSQYVITLDPPLTPLARSKPTKKANLIFSIVFGIIFGSLTVIILQLFRDSNKKEKNKVNEAKLLVIKNLKELFFLKNK